MTDFADRFGEITSHFLTLCLKEIRSSAVIPQLAHHNCVDIQLFSPFLLLLPSFSFYSKNLYIFVFENLN